ncbi:MAG TPA: hypothetical protein VNU46_03960 [Gemmatimonadaceae bacterium]|jgi:hypothetical protein|nr:hypothetical protein [Gemmatimonadaceae bacterium]
MSVVFSPEESELLDRIAIRMELERLSPLDRALMTLRVAYRVPKGYAGPWPPTSASVGAYAGPRYLGRPLSATSVKERVQHLLEYWRERYHEHPDTFSHMMTHPSTQSNSPSVPSLCRAA